MEYLHYGEIRANILDVDEVHALLIEIDENLQRAELTELQRSQHITERKRIWESLHPQTKHGKNPGAGRGKGKKAPVYREDNLSSLQSHDSDASVVPTLRAFVDETAVRTQVNAKTIQRSARIGEKICRPAQDLLVGTRIEDNQAELLRLAAVKDTDQQVAIATLIHEDQAPSVLAAQRLLDAEKLNQAPPPLPTGPFDVLVVDPPWAFKKRTNDSSKKGNVPYAMMTQTAIEALPIPTLAAPNAILWLWSTNAHLPEAFAIVDHWGFTYKTLLTWDKMRFGTGDWLRGQTEHCLLCVRGKPPIMLTNESTLVQEMRTRHSKKPEAFYARVEQLCPGSKVELFAREPRDGWAIWGNLDALAVPQQRLLA